MVELFIIIILIYLILLHLFLIFQIEPKLNFIYKVFKENFPEEK